MADFGGIGDTIDPTTLRKRTFEAGRWGNQGNDVDGLGNDVTQTIGGDGTSGADIDADRYRNMGQNPVNMSAPRIDQSRTNQSREIGMGSLGMLRNRAEGGITPAQQLAQQQVTGAVNAIQSGAASIKGGAMARAAAGRNAQFAGAQTQAMGNQDVQALRAREMAEGASQLFGASTAQRAADLNLASEQSRMEAAHRAAADQREGFYEGLNIDTKKAELDHMLGRTAADQAALNAQNATNNAADATSRQQADRAASGITGAIKGAAEGYANTTNDGSGGAKVPPRAGIIHENPYSDPRAKTNIRDLSPSGMVTKENIVPMSGYEDTMVRPLAAIASDGGDATLEWDGGTKGQGHSRVVRTSDDAAASSGEGSSGKARRGGSTGGKVNLADAERARADAIAARKAADAADSPKARVRQRSMRMSDADLERMANEMLGGVQAQSVGQLGRGAAVRDSMTSDPKAKREAFADGMNHADQMQSSGKVPPMPAYMGKPKPKNASERMQPESEPRRSGAADWDERPDRPAQPKNWAQRADEAISAEVDTTRPGDPLFKRAAQGAGRAMSWMMGRGQQEQPMAPPPPAPVPAGAPVAARPPVMDELGFLSSSANVTSDPKAKTSAHEAPMANSNRSMAASSYEYKPEFTPPEQRFGERNVGPMADKMKADPVAGTAIVTNPENGLLAIDKTKGLKLVMGGLSSVQRQIDELKARKAR